MKPFFLIAFSLSAFATKAQIGTVVNVQPSRTINLPASASPSDIALLDVESNSRLDVAVAQAGLNSVAVYRQDASGGFTLAPMTYPLEASPTAIAALDYNTQSKADDLIVACSNYTYGGVFNVLANTKDADGTLVRQSTTYYNFANSAPQAHLAVGYITRDSHPEVVFGLEVGGLTGFRVASYRGAGGWTLDNRTVVGGPPAGLALEDMDGDGFTDVVVTVPRANYVRVYRHTNSSAVAPYSIGEMAEIPTLGINPVDVATADLNRDSRPDLVAINSGDNTVSVVLTTGPMRFSTPVIMTQAAAPRKVLLADLNNDQYADLITINADNTLNIYQHTYLPGPSRYGTPLTLATGADPVAVRVGDFNGDQKLDVAVVCAGDNTVRIYENVSRPLSLKKGQLVGVDVYPNPAVDKMTIELPTNAVAATQLQLFDGTGRMILQQQVKAMTKVVSLPVEQLPRGIYVLKVMSSQGVMTQRVVLE